MQKEKEKNIKLASLKLNDGSHGLPKNPRFIKDKRFEALCESVKENPEFMPPRPIVVDEDGVILGGNMRYRACRELGMTEIPMDWVRVVKGLSVEKKRRFIILDNRGFGDDDFDLLANEWDIEELIGAGFDPSEFAAPKTSELSDYEFRDMYYSPKNKPSLRLKDCFDLHKFQKKLDVIDSSDLPETSKVELKLLAFRFIKIDFQSIAEYYAFNASDAEKKIIEELRGVLVDGTAGSFMQSDIEQIYSELDAITEGEDND